MITSWIEGLGQRALVSYEDNRILVDSTTVARFFKVSKRVLQALAAVGYLPQPVSGCNGKVLVDFEAIRAIRKEHKDDWPEFVRKTIEEEKEGFLKRLDDYVKLCKKLLSKEKTQI